VSTEFTHAFRLLRKTPGLSAVAILCLALAIGLATATFIVVHGAFLSPLPLPGGDRLVMVHEYDRAGRFNVPMTAAQFTLRRERSRSFDVLGAWYTRTVTLTQPGPGAASPGLVRAAYVSPHALAALGIAPQMGRHAADTDVAPGAMPVVVLGHAVWRNRLGGDARIEDRSVHIAGRPHRVIGVMPPGFAFPVREDVWIPVQTDSRAPDVTQESLTLFGRLRAGVSSQEAMAELTVLAASDERRDPLQATTPLVMPFERGYMTSEDEWAIYAVLAGVTAFLIVIAANLANLFLARNSARTREIALRAALGASRGRLVAQLLVESAVLAAAGALAGVLVAHTTVTWFQAQVGDLPWWADFSLSPVVFAFVAGAAMLATAVAGIGPAVRLTRRSILPSMQTGRVASNGLRFSRIGAALLVAQVAVSVGALSVVGVLAQALFGFTYQNYRIGGSDVLVAQVYLGAPPAAELSRPDANRRDVWLRYFERSRETFERIRARLRAESGVREATFASVFPGNDVETTRIEIQSGAAGGVATRTASIGPGFFDTLGVSVAGRDFGAADRRGPPRVAIVNAPFAAKYFAGASPLGRSIRVLADADARPGPWLQIVGVVPDLGLNPGDLGRADGIYVPFEPSNFARLAIRTDGEPTTLVPRLHEIVSSENARAQVQSAKSLESQMHEAERVFRSLGVGFVLFGGTALLLSAVSFYSLVAFGVTRRTREIGIRIALGATRLRILRSVLGRELLVIGWGAAAGVLLGMGAYRLVAVIPFDLRPAGPSLLAAFVGLMLVVGVGACLLPARRAMSIAPADALRRE
jgi:putative ABC transport system permease protein